MDANFRATLTPEEILQQQSAIARLKRNPQDFTIVNSSATTIDFDVDYGCDVVQLTDGSICYCAATTNGVRGIGDTVLLHDGEITTIDAPETIKKSAPIPPPKFTPCTGRVAIVFTENKFLRTETIIVKPAIKRIVYGFYNPQVFSNLREYEGYRFDYKYPYNFGEYLPGMPPGVSENERDPFLDIFYNPQVRSDSQNYLIGFSQPEVDPQDPDQPPYWKGIFQSVYHTPNSINEFYLAAQIYCDLNLTRGDTMPPLPSICSILFTRRFLAADYEDYTYEVTNECKLDNPTGGVTLGYIREEISPQETTSMDVYETEFYLGGIYPEPIRLELPITLEERGVVFCTLVKRKVIVKILYGRKYIRSIHDFVYEKVAIFTITGSSPDDLSREIYTYPQAITAPPDDWQAPLYRNYKFPTTKEEISNNRCLQDHIYNLTITGDGNSFNLKSRGNKLYYMNIESSSINDFTARIKSNDVKVNISQAGLFEGRNNAPEG